MEGGVIIFSDEMQSIITDFAKAHPEVDILERIDVSHNYPYMDKNIIFVGDSKRNIGFDIDVTKTHYSDIEDTLASVLWRLDNI